MKPGKVGPNALIKYLDSIAAVIAIGPSLLWLTVSYIQAVCFNGRRLFIFLSLIYTILPIWPALTFASGIPQTYKVSDFLEYVAHSCHV